MVMVNVVYWLPTGGLMAHQADWLGPKFVGHWRCFCIHRVNSRSAVYADSIINIVKILLLLFLNPRYSIPEGMKY